MATSSRMRWPAPATSMTSHGDCVALAQGVRGGDWHLAVVAAMDDPGRHHWCGCTGEAATDDDDRRGRGWGGRGPAQAQLQEARSDAQRHRRRAVLCHDDDLVRIDVQGRGVTHREQPERLREVGGRGVVARRAIVGRGHDVASVAKGLHELTDVGRSLSDRPGAAAEDHCQWARRSVGVRVDVERKRCSLGAAEPDVHQRAWHQGAALRASGCQWQALLCVRVASRQREKRRHHHDWDESRHSVRPGSARQASAHRDHR